MFHKCNAMFQCETNGPWPLFTYEIGPLLIDEKRELFQVRNSMKQV